MRLNINRPEILCWISIPFLLLLGLLTFGRTREIHLHDTYYVLNNLHVGIFFGLLLTLLGYGYWLVKRIKGIAIRVLSIIHLVLTVGGILTIMVLIVLETEDYIVLKLLDEQVLLAFIVIILAQPIYIINLIIRILRR